MIKPSAVWREGVHAKYIQVEIVSVDGWRNCFLQNIRSSRSGGGGGGGGRGAKLKATPCRGGGSASNNGTYLKEG